ncbi:MAG: hypothetical protein QG632_247 [Candidatus Dependentiae bacterium]|nr:hypothetical protein [Candidatus Dependentiae bacterium]
MGKIKRILVPGVLMVCMSFGVLAREFRAPIVVSQGGWDFDPREKSQWHITSDVDWYSRSAHRAFGSFGLKAGELSTLFFNADTFRMSHIFEHCLVAHNTEFYNPFMRTMLMQPRVEYYENGMNVAMNISRTVLDGKGAWGIRVKAPIRAIDTVRKDIESRRDSQTEDVARFQINQVASTQVGFAYRLDFLEAIPTTDFSSSRVNYAAIDGSNTYIDIFAEDPRSGGAGAVYVPEGMVPRATQVGVLYTSTFGAPALPASLTGLDEQTIYAFGNGSFSGLADSASINTSTRVANQDKKATVWVTSTHEAGGAYHGSGTATGSISSGIKDYISSFNANVHQWLYERGYIFQTTRQVGLGDIDIETYYDHSFGDRIVGGVSALLRLPTACGSGSDESNYTGNPYRSHTGNGRHFEVGAGLHLNAETRSWLMMHVDAEYRFALARTEKTCGTPVESMIKNIGSVQLADVSWHSVVANGELHFCHPQTTDITGYIGYQFYWKRKDTVRFTSSTVDSWLGAKYSSTTQDYTVDNSIALDNNLAAANTEQFANRVKAGVVYHLSDWLSIRAGAALTFAGQNMPKEADVYAGCRVTF